MPPPEKKNSFTTKRDNTFVEGKQPKPALKDVAKKNIVNSSKPKLEDNDSWLENIVEFIDPTGLTSYDDVYRSYKNTGLSGETALEALGALPLMGKIGKSGKVIVGGFDLLTDAVKAAKYLPSKQQKQVVDKAFELYQNYSKSGGKELDKFLGSGTEFIKNKIPLLNPVMQRSSDKLINAYNTAFKAGKGYDAYQAATGSKDNSGLKRTDNGFQYNGRNILPDVANENMYGNGGSSKRDNTTVVSNNLPKPSFKENVKNPVKDASINIAPIKGFGEKPEDTELVKLIKESQPNIRTTPKQPYELSSGAAEYVPVESMLLPASLPLKATSNLGKAALVAAESLNPVSGFRGTGNLKNALGELERNITINTLNSKPALELRKKVISKILQDSQKNANLSIFDPKQLEYLKKTGMVQGKEGGIFNDELVNMIGDANGTGSLRNYLKKRILNSYESSSRPRFYSNDRTFNAEINLPNEYNNNTGSLENFSFFNNNPRNAGKTALELENLAKTLPGKWNFNPGSLSGDSYPMWVKIINRQNPEQFAVKNIGSSPFNTSGKFSDLSQGIRNHFHGGIDSEKYIKDIRNNLTKQVSDKWNVDINPEETFYLKPNFILNKKYKYGGLMKLNKYNYGGYMSKHLYPTGGEDSVLNQASVLNQSNIQTGEVKAKDNTLLNKNKKIVDTKPTINPNPSIYSGKDKKVDTAGIIGSVGTGLSNELNRYSYKPTYTPPVNYGTTKPTEIKLEGDPASHWTAFNDTPNIEAPKVDTYTMDTTGAPEPTTGSLDPTTSSTAGKSSGYNSQAASNIGGTTATVLNVGNQIYNATKNVDDKYNTHLASNEKYNKEYTEAQNKYKSDKDIVDTTSTTLGTIGAVMSAIPVVNAFSWIPALLAAGTKAIGDPIVDADYEKNTRNASLTNFNMASPEQYSRNLKYNKSNNNLAPESSLASFGGNIYANGGGVNSLEGDLISKVIMNRNKDKDFVQRAYASGEYPNSNMFTRFDDNNFGEKNTHLMSWGEDDSGQAYMYPEVLNPKNEAVKVPNQYADYISNKGYKKATGMKEYANGGPVTFSSGGEKHKVYIKKSPTGLGKGVEGHVMVNHPTMDKGKWDTIDLTKKAGAKTVAQGVAATKKWHKENPSYAMGGPIKNTYANGGSSMYNFPKGLTHEQHPWGGYPIGGNNYVESGEVVLDKPDGGKYIFSKRLNYR